MSSLYRIDIAPLTPLPLTRAPFFSYRHEGPLPLGTLVQVPFGRRSLRGIVYAAAPLPSGRAPLWLKPIERVIREGWLTKEQRLLAETISETYFSSLGNTLKHFVFPLSKKNTVTHATATPQKKSSSTRSKKLKITGWKCVNDEVFFEKLVALLEDTKSSPKASLVIVPDLFLLATLEEKLASFFPEKLLALSSKLTPKQMDVAWQKIRSGEALIILGTRQALFAPFAQLRQIIILFPEERLSYKQWDMTPHYEVIVGTQALARLFHAPLVLLTPSPGLLNQGVENQKHWKTIGISSVNPLTLIDRRKDGKGARSHIFSKELTKLLTGLGSGTQALFIAKERGVSGVLICQSCRTTARCPSCQHVLSENKEGILRCLHCSYESNFFPKCSQCGHMHFTSFGVGTIRLERELERHFPRQPLLRIDRDTLGKASEFKKEVKRFLKETTAWIVTTPEIGTLLQLPKQDLIVMLEADHALAFPDFEGEVRLATEIERLQAKLGPQGLLAIQTFSPEERVWQRLCHNEHTELWQGLYGERESFGYPPVTAIIKVSLLPENNVPGADTLESIQKRFQKTFQEHAAIEITPVYTTKQKWGTSSPNFLIKYPAEQALPETLITLLRRESAHLKIDVHPLHLH